MLAVCGQIRNIALSQVRMHGSGRDDDITAAVSPASQVVVRQVATEHTVAGKPVVQAGPQGYGGGRGRQRRMSLPAIEATARGLLQAHTHTPSSKSLDSATLKRVFMDRLATNLHVMLTLSPPSVATPHHLLSAFPAIAACTTIDCFTGWSPEALTTVALRRLEELKDEVGDTGGLQELVVLVCDMHRQGLQLWLDAQAEGGRAQGISVEVTPSHFLDLLLDFATEFKIRAAESTRLIERYKTGVSQLEATAERIDEMTTELEDLKPGLVAAAEETREVMEQMTAETREVEAIRGSVAAEESEANATAEEAREIQRECEEDLSQATPALEAAVKALKALRKPDIVELKSMTSPPGPVRLVMEVVCLLLDVKPTKVRRCISSMC